MSEPRIEVVDVPERSRFELLVDGKLAGLEDYELGDGVISYVHTEVADAYEGRGLGSKIARAILDSARERGLSVIPRCPYIAGWIKKHPDDADLVHPEHKDLIA